jgi:hypothetical protein
MKLDRNADNHQRTSTDIGEREALLEAIGGIPRNISYQGSSNILASKPTNTNSITDSPQAPLFACIHFSSSHVLKSGMIVTAPVPETLLRAHCSPAPLLEGLIDAGRYRCFCNKKG